MSLIQGQEFWSSSLRFVLLVSRLWCYRSLGTPILTLHLQCLNDTYVVRRMVSALYTKTLCGAQLTGCGNRMMDCRMGVRSHGMAWAGGALSAS